MIDDKKIEDTFKEYNEKVEKELSKRLTRKPTRAERYADTTSRQCAFYAGAKWAINEFIKNLWHPANKIPKKFNHYGFAALYILQYNHQIRMVLYDKDNMSWKNVISNSEYWLYVDDLLPKQKGGEQ